MSTKLKWLTTIPTKPGYYWHIDKVYIVIQADAKAEGCKVGNIFDSVGLALVHRDLNSLNFYRFMYEVKGKYERLFIPIWCDLNSKEVAWWAGPLDHKSVIRPKLPVKLARLIND
jgi:hypothetical protein